MPRMLSPRATWQLVRAGNLRARLRVTREGQAAARLQLVGAALDLGVLDALAEAGAGTADLAQRTGVTDTELFDAFLRVLAAAGFVARHGAGSWRLLPAGRAVLDDDLVRASYEAFSGLHPGLYRDLPAQMAGGPPRRDVVEQGGVIARVSAAFEPFVADLLTRTVTRRRPRRIFDIGCGAGLQLATMLAAAPEATGVGVDVEPDAVVRAERTLARRGLADRATVLEVDVRHAVASGPTGALDVPFDLALMANVIYYVPVDERVPFLRAVAGLLAPGGVLLVVTTVVTPHLFSRHFDLLLRAQEGRMELPDARGLVGQLQEAGLRPGPVERIAPAARSSPCRRPCCAEPTVRHRPGTLCHRAGRTRDLRSRVGMSQRSFPAAAAFPRLGSAGGDAYRRPGRWVDGDSMSGCPATAVRPRTRDTEPRPARPSGRGWVSG